MLLPKEYLGSLCEIRSLSNNLMALARICNIRPRILEMVGYIDGQIPIMAYQMPVKIYTHNLRAGTCILGGIVYLSSSEMVRVENVELIQDHDRRGAVRVNAHVQALLYQVHPDNLDNQYNNLYTPCIDVEIMDISLSGLQITSHVLIGIGQKYYIDFTLLKRPLHFFIIVQRLVDGCGHKNICGCSFCDVTDRETDTLCRVLFDLQRQEKNRNQ